MIGVFPFLALGMVAYPVLALPATVSTSTGISPISTGMPGDSPYPNITMSSTTTVTYYQGSSVDSSSCGMIGVATGHLTADVCTSLHTYSIGIQQIQGDECSFTLYRNSGTCGGTVEAGVQKEIVTVPSGNGVTCVVAGVEDGGMYEKASGVWACA